MFRLDRIGALLLWFVSGIPSTCFAEPPSLRIYIHNDALLNPKDFATAILELERILSSTGAEPGVCVHLKKDSETRCASGLRKGRLFDIRILPGSASHMHSVLHSPLGHSIVDEGGGMYAAVFLGTIRNQASAAGVPVTLLLAYAAAHEFGHLLLGANAHSRQGVMKAAWARTDLIAMSQRSLRFDNEQCRRISECCKSTSPTDVAHIR